jgi:hypothetical protein
MAERVQSKMEIYLDGDLPSCRGFNYSKVDAASKSGLSFRENASSHHHSTPCEFELFGLKLFPPDCSHPDTLPRVTPIILIEHSTPWSRQRSSVRLLAAAYLFQAS